MEPLQNLLHHTISDGWQVVEQELEMASTTTKSSMESTQPPQPNPKSQDVNFGPLPAYDLFLRALGESYLDFFAERLRIEEQYRDAMTRLLHRQRNVDSRFEERLPEHDWTLRRAWRDICDGLDRESEVRCAFINSLRTDVVGPLLELKETHERSRKRIKEDIKSSFTQYMEYAENVLPRLRRTYLKRSQEVDEWRSAGEPKPTVTSPVISNPMLPKPGMPLPQPSMHTGQVSTVSASAAGNMGGQAMPRGRQSSIHVPARRDRSPGSNQTSFSDLAQQGKRQLNNLRTLIETKGVGRDGNNAKAEAAMRVVRAKREADDADKDYRRGVHTMETLRLRRAKTLEAGYTSLETLVSESAELMSSILQRYSDNLTATNATNSQLSTSLAQVVDEINPIQDLQRLRQLTNATLAQAIPKRTLYYNYQVGECKDMLFGVSLVDYASSRGLKDNELPKIVALCIAEVESRGLKTEGIYRVSGKHTTVMELSLLAEQDEGNFQFDRVKDDIHCVASLLKFYLRELPDAVFKIPVPERVQYAESRERHMANNFAMIRSKIRRLPGIHQATLRAMLEHLARVSTNQQNTKMDAKNLAVVFGPVLLGEETPVAGLDILTMPKDTLMEDLINNVGMLYDYHGPEERAVSPPLPNPPDQDEDDIPLAGTLNPRSNIPIYGSSHTVIKTLPASTTSEIAPKLPPRPSNRQPRRATISSGSAAADPSASPSNVPKPPTTGQSPSRPSEDGRATGYSRTSQSPRSPTTPATGTSKPQPRLELKTHSANTSATSSPIKERGVGTSTTTTTSYSAPSSKNTSDVALMPSQPPVVASNSTGDSAIPLSTTLNAPKRPSYSDSLLREPAVLISQGIRVSDENLATMGGPNLALMSAPYGEELEEVDYPGSPETSALEFRTAVNTPEAEEHPHLLGGLGGL